MLETPNSSKPIRHVVFFSSKNPQDIPTIMDELKVLGQIPHLLHFEVSQNLRQDRYGNDVDVIVYAEFANEEEMAAYRSHQIYQDCIQKVRPLRNLRIAADF